METDSADEVVRPRLLLVVALALGALADLLLFGQDVGLGGTLFLLALPAGFLALCARSGQPVAWRETGSLLAAHTLFAVMLSVRANGFVTGLNIAACALLLSLLAGFGRTGGVAALQTWHVLWAPLELAWHATFRAAPHAMDAAREVRTNVGSRERVTPVLRGLLLTLPVLLILVPLLMSADAIFEKQTVALFDALLPRDWPTRFGRLLLALLTAWLVAGGLVFAVTRTSRDPDERPRESLPLGLVEASIVLGSVVALFASFLAVQMKYLFGGAARVLSMPALDYKAYVHRGFGELIAVAVLTLALVLTLGSVARRESSSRQIAFAALSTALIGETLVILLSAWKRMAAFEVAYGATVTRVQVDTFIVWLGIALLWLAATLWHERLDRRFAVGGLVCALGFAATLDVVNPDALAVRSMAARWVSVQYVPNAAVLAELAGGDAYAEASRLSDRLPDEPRKAFQDATRGLEESRNSHRPWASWHWARRR